MNRSHCSVVMGFFGCIFCEILFFLFLKHKDGVPFWAFFLRYLTGNIKSPLFALVTIALQTYSESGRHGQKLGEHPLLPQLIGNEIDPEGSGDFLLSPTAFKTREQVSNIGFCGSIIGTFSTCLASLHGALIICKEFHKRIIRQLPYFILLF